MQALIDPDEKELLNTLSLIELAFD